LVSVWLTVLLPLCTITGRFGSLRFGVALLDHLADEAQPLGLALALDAQLEQPAALAVQQQPRRHHAPRRTPCTSGVVMLSKSSVAARGRTLQEPAACT
jgi:hypothetical protein